MMGWERFWQQNIVSFDQKKGRQYISTWKIQNCKIWLMTGWRLEMPTLASVVHLNIGPGSLNLPKKFFLHRSATPVGGISFVPKSAARLLKRESAQRLIFHRKSKAAPSLPGFLCRLRLSVNNSWRERRQRHRGALSLRGSNAGIWTDLHGPLRDENSQWDWDPGSGTRVRCRIRCNDRVKGSGSRINHKDKIQGPAGPPEMGIAIMTKSQNQVSGRCTVRIR